ncbi:MAG: phage holin family protein [Gammaproteobacteria bacterium]
MTPAHPGLLDEARLLFTEARGLAHDRLKLAALETRLAGQSVVRMLIAGVVAAVMVISTWLALVGMGVVALVVYGGLTAIAALGIAAVVNAAAAAALYFAIRKMSQNLAFPRTVGGPH